MSGFGYRDSTSRSLCILVSRLAFAASPAVATALADLGVAAVLVTLAVLASVDPHQSVVVFMVVAHLYSSQWPSEEAPMMPKTARAVSVKWRMATISSRVESSRIRSITRRMKRWYGVILSSATCLCSIFSWSILNFLSVPVARDPGLLQTVANGHAKDGAVVGVHGDRLDLGFRVGRQENAQGQKDGEYAEHEVHGREGLHVRPRLLRIPRHTGRSFLGGYGPYGSRNQSLPRAD